MEAFFFAPLPFHSQGFQYGYPAENWGFVDFIDEFSDFSVILFQGFHSIDFESGI